MELDAHLYSEIENEGLRALRYADLRLGIKDRRTRMLGLNDRCPVDGNMKFSKSRPFEMMTKN